MKKLFNCLLLSAAGAVACGAHADTLSLSYTAGHYGDDCERSAQGGVIPSTGASCEVETALPVPAGKTIKQVTVYYGEQISGAGGLIQAELRYKELKSGNDASNFGGTAIASWWASSNMVETYMASQNLLTQTGIPPYVSYPDSFVALSDRTYTVRIVLDDTAEYFGLRVLYQ